MRVKEAIRIKEGTYKWKCVLSNRDWGNILRESKQLIVLALAINDFRKLSSYTSKSCINIGDILLV